METENLTLEDGTIARSCPLMRALPEHAFEAVLKGGEVFRLARGETLFDVEETAKNLFVVLDGRIKLTNIDAGGRAHVIAIFSRGESLAEAVAFIEARYPAAAEAITDARVLSIRGGLFLDVMMSDRAVLGSGLAAIYRHLHYLVSEVENLKSRTIRQRTAAFLVGLAPQESGPARIELPFEKALLAAKIGTSPENLSRTLASLGEFGVRIDRSRVEIADLAVLRKEAGLDAGG